MTFRSYRDGVLRQFWDDATRLYTEYDAQGVQTFQRPYTAQEIAQATADSTLAVSEVNRQDLLTRAASAQAGNATFLADTAVTTAEAVTQLQRLTRQVNALIKLATNDLQTQDGT